MSSAFHRSRAATAARTSTCVQSRPLTQGPAAYLLFASDLPSGPVAATRAQEAIRRTERRFGSLAVCVAEVAQEFGDHPELASRRMQWARHIATELGARPDGGVRR